MSALDRLLGTAEPPTTVAVDTIVTALSTPRRRHVLRLCEPEEPTGIGVLAEEIAAIENGVPRSAVTGQQRKRVYVSLYQTHLDKLQEWDLLDERNRLTPGGEIAVEALEQLTDVRGVVQ